VLVVVLKTPEKDSVEHSVKECYLYNTIAHKVLSKSPILVTGLSQWCEDKSVILRLQASFNLEVPISDDGKYIYYGEVITLNRSINYLNKEF